MGLMTKAGASVFWGRRRTLFLDLWRTARNCR